MAPHNALCKKFWYTLSSLRPLRLVYSPLCVLCVSVVKKIHHCTGGTNILQLSKTFDMKHSEPVIETSSTSGTYQIVPMLY